MERDAESLAGGAGGGAADSGLRCPECGYNLTGLSENRCPECGGAFDPEELRRMLAGEAMPIPGWDDRGETNILVAFFRVCWMTWFHPVRFAREFPACYKRDSAINFWLLTKATVLVSAIVTGTCFDVLTAAGGRFVFASLLAMVGVVGQSCVCEVALEVVFSSPAISRVGSVSHGPPISSSSWWGFVVFHGSYLILSTPVVLLPALLLFHEDATGWLTSVVLAGGMGVMIGWWSYALGIGATQRTLPTTGRIVAIILIPVVGVASGALCLAPFFIAIV